MKGSDAGGNEGLCNPLLSRERGAILILPYAALMEMDLSHTSTEMGAYR